MQHLSLIWNRLEEILIAFLLAAMTLTTFVYVLLNNLYAVFYFLGDHFAFAENLFLAIGDFILFSAQEMTWSIALTKAMFGWLIFIGLAWGVRIGAHIGVDMIVRLFKPANQRLILILALLICIGYAGLMTYSSEEWVSVLYQNGIYAEDLDRFGVKQWHITLIVPIGFALVLLRFVQLLISNIQGKQMGFGGHSEAEEALKLAEQEPASVEHNK